MQIEAEIDQRSEPALGVVVGLPGAIIRWAMLEFLAIASNYLNIISRMERRSQYANAIPGLLILLFKLTIPMRYADASVLQATQRSQIRKT